jgi:bifunctional oligoribonuclease and PAP phosphatase NrnA
VDGLQRALRFFGAHDSFILTTHEGSDADGIGAEILLTKALRSLNKGVRVVNSDVVQARFAFLDPENLIEHWNPIDHASLAAGSALVVLDSDEMNLGVVGEELVPKAVDVFIVDHHEPPEDGYAGGYIDTTASSTSELALNIVRGLGVAIDPISARSAFAGIVYDTGSFMYPKTSVQTFHAAVELVSAGAVPNEIYQALYESSSIGSLLLQKRVLASLDLLANGRVAIQTMLRSDILAAGALYEDAEPLINIPLHCKDVEVSILFKESEEGRLRCSLRSKGAVNVSLIAQGFGGGGHRTAAGFKCKNGLAETREEVLQKVSAALPATDSGE